MPTKRHNIVVNRLRAARGRRLSKRKQANSRVSSSEDLPASAPSKRPAANASLPSNGQHFAAADASLKRSRRAKTSVISNLLVRAGSVTKKPKRATSALSSRFAVRAEASKRARRSTHSPLTSCYQLSSAAPPDLATDRAIDGLPSSPRLRDRVAIVREIYRQRQDVLNAVGNLARQANRIVARTLQVKKPTPQQVKEHTPPVFLEMMKMPREVKAQFEKILTYNVHGLPVWKKWGKDVRGFGAISMAAILGEAGDLSDFATVAKLWKFMGMGLIDGERQRKVAGDPEKAIKHGYCARRRSVMFVIGDCLIKASGAYKAVYDARKAYETAKNEACDYRQQAWAQLKKLKSDSEGASALRKIYESGKLTPKHIHLRAKRYMEKRLLRDLWRAWRDRHFVDVQESNVSPRTTIQEEARA